MRNKIIILILLSLSLLNASEYADIVNVKANKAGNKYSFSVSVQSPDISCEQYANWWEILSEDGKLLYRRILWHSHTKEQPVTRSGGSLTLRPSQIIYIRAHLNNRGYGGDVYKGSVLDGFLKTSDYSFDKSIESLKPQATECWY